ncbi:helix-turn-helix transcriptional regulator [Spirosoma agri]|uniref:Helix-turn-helix transcriptional regulator n=1 Tax=Spirosoma agri TaxID=1987381 RepID=A0A6M0IHD7_9BACT|nr:helix-turn-helix transcriptional regulator [Spirosoma agri]NEU67105.1 helix-turn-helix transcriptional regulator [Spirosoma agri]
MIPLPEVLKRLMDDKGLKQKDIADFLGISKQVVSNWFTRGYKPELEQMPKLAELFGISVDDFFKIMDGKVVETNTKGGLSENGLTVSEAYQMQKKISELQDQLIQYQAKELEEKNRQIENKSCLRPDQDITSTTTTPKLAD